MFVKKLALLLIIGGISSCYYDVEDELYITNNCELPVEISFESDVNPIIQQSCAISGCHTSENQVRVNLENYTGVISTIENGSFQSYTFDNLSMPPASPLDACTIELLKNWINNGSLNN